VIDSTVAGAWDRGRGSVMLDSEEKQLYLGATAILIFAMALIYFQQ
jgi:hypothetical protein